MVMMQFCKRLFVSLCVYAARVQWYIDASDYFIAEPYSETAFHNVGYRTLPNVTGSDVSSTSLRSGVISRLDSRGLSLSSLQDVVKNLSTSEQLLKVIKEETLPLPEEGVTRVKLENPEGMNFKREHFISGKSFCGHPKMRVFDFAARTCDRKTNPRYYRIPIRMGEYLIHLVTCDLKLSHRNSIQILYNSRLMAVR